MLEGGLVHWLLSSRELWLAVWVAAGLHLYGLVWILGDMHAARLKPSRLGEGTFEVSVGVRVAASVPRRAIVSAEAGSWERADLEEGAALARIFGAANVRIESSEPFLVKTLFASRHATVVYLQVDQPTKLLEALNASSLSTPAA